MSVLITRTTGGDTVGGKPAPHRGDGRVYVVAVEWDAESISSTTDREKATRFRRHIAEALVARHWRGRDPRVEVLDDRVEEGRGD